MSGGYTGFPAAYYNENATQGYYETGAPELGAYNTAYGLSTTDGNTGGFTGLLAPGGIGRETTGIMTGGKKTSNRRKSAKGKSVKRKSVKGKSVKGKSVKGKSAKGKSVKW